MATLSYKNTLMETNVKHKVLKASQFGATKTLKPEDSGATIVLDRAAGTVITLPKAQEGLNFEFTVLTSVTSNAYKFSTLRQGTEFFIGQLISVDTDTTNALAYDQVGNGTTHDNISMNGTTTGGLIYTNFRARAISSTQWLVEGTNFGSGAVATPFATS
jgi:hypothetical protein